MIDRLQDLYQQFFGSHVFVSPIYLVSFAAIAWAVYRMRSEKIGFLRWLLPRAIWTHRSTRLDLILFTIGQLMHFFGIVTRFVATPAVAVAVAGFVPATPFEDVFSSPILLALVFWVVGDFAIYWVHRAHHSIEVIWPLHAVHHSAAVMTPFTAYRQHPLGILVSAAFHSVITGAVLGLLVGVLQPSATTASIAGANAFFVIANLTVTNFQHTHIWISFGPILERLFISPAQHQVHHSTDPAHFNRNFGQTLAIWDWVFGTLYITKSDECVTFGLDNKADAPLMTHRLWPVLWDPMRRMFSVAKGRP
ncbi:MAG: sterol desaturase family protein [Pseudomonadota bacterium]